ncbi:hypothetical protein KEH51_12810 [[Brevibacterium] frigoritolerans]|uniref:Uncharacterized protein n=1 Tax=Peribacillus frigoritolerans TaxID=450367 RepID=A0A941JAP5_9BACI|nr:hypothetical protein [Peribacillus frigoritolerans]
MISTSSTSTQSSETIFTIHGEEYVLEKTSFLEGEAIGGLASIKEISQVQKLESLIRKRLFSAQWRQECILTSWWR